MHTVYLIFLLFFKLMCAFSLNNPLVAQLGNAVPQTWQTRVMTAKLQRGKNPIMGGFFFMHI